MTLKARVLYGGTPQYFEKQLNQFLETITEETLIDTKFHHSYVLDASKNVNELFSVTIIYKT
jgi:hypothetical protein